jgi:hypothetical protein
MAVGREVDAFLASFDLRLSLRAMVTASSLGGRRTVHAEDGLLGAQRRDLVTGTEP